MSRRNRMGAYDVVQAQGKTEALDHINGGDSTSKWISNFLEPDFAALSFIPFLDALLTDVAVIVLGQRNA